MGIMEALERAKQMGKLRQKELAAQAEPTHSSHIDAGAVSGARDAAPFERRPAEHFAALERIEFDVATCAKYNILLTDEQVSAAGHAAAAYRLLRGRVLHRIKEGNWSCVGITSAGAAEGKTVTVQMSPFAVTTTNVRFIDGSKLLIGDNTTGKFFLDRKGILTVQWLLKEIERSPM